MSALCNIALNLDNDYYFGLGEPIILALCNMALNLENEGYREQVDCILSLCQTLFPDTMSQYSKVWV